MLRSLTDHVRETLGPKGYRVRYPEEVIRELSHKLVKLSNVLKESGGNL